MWFSQKIVLVLVLHENMYLYIYGLGIYVRGEYAVHHPHFNFLSTYYTRQIQMYRKRYKSTNLNSCTMVGCANLSSTHIALCSTISSSTIYGRSNGSLFFKSMKRYFAKCQEDLVVGFRMIIQ